MISEVVGVSGNSGAFVFGMYSLLDKFSNGILIYMILGSHLMNENNPMFIRIIITVVPSVGCFLAWVMMLLGGSPHSNSNNNYHTSNADS